MGYDYCSGCRKRDSRDDLVYPCCDKDDEGDLCEDCSFKPKPKCGNCKDSFCRDHGENVKNKCCGLVLCCDCEESHSKSVIKKCGHTTCHFYKGCRVCDASGEQEKQATLILADKPHVEKLLKICKSEKLKDSLTRWLKEAKTESDTASNAPAAKKRKRSVKAGR